MATITRASDDALIEWLVERLPVEEQIQVPSGARIREAREVAPWRAQARLGDKEPVR